MNITNNNDLPPIREETLEGTSLRIGFIQMKDFKLCAYNASRYVLAGNVLVVQGSNGKKSVLSTATAFQRMKEHNAAANIA